MDLNHVHKHTNVNYLFSITSIELNYVQLSNFNYLRNFNSSACLQLRHCFFLMRFYFADNSMIEIR